MQVLSHPKPDKILHLYPFLAIRNTMPAHEQSVANKLLVAMPDLVGGFFEKSVVLMLEHDHKGAMGLTLTHPATLTLDGLLKNLEMPITHNSIVLEQHVMVGGPVQPERGFILHSGNAHWQNTSRISTDLSMTVSLDFLQALADDKIEDDCAVFLGYAGWGAGQLEQELRDSHWLFAEVSHDIIFDLPPEARWQAAFDSLGFNIHQLSRVTGHA
jgi:putative transcriptional regulator